MYKPGLSKKQATVQRFPQNICLISLHNLKEKFVCLKVLYPREDRFVFPSIDFSSAASFFRQTSMNSTYLIRQQSGLSRSLRDGDFEEDDVWGVLKGRKYDSGESIDSPRSFPRSIPTTARMVPRGSSGSSSSNHASPEARVMQQSAPVNIPDWSKLCGKNANRISKDATSILDGDDTDEEYGDPDDQIVKDGVDSDDGDERDDFDYDCKMPPHEFIARRFARSQISSFSVFEGVGRTLKGRDLSKVRNAVLTKTGFLESL